MSLLAYLPGYKELLSLLAIALTFVAFIPYIRSIQQGKTRPHIISWVIWGSTTVVVFFAQLADKGGAGAWPIGVSGCVTLYIAGLAYVKCSSSTGALNITRMDTLFLLASVMALPLWYISNDPLWAVIVLTAVDVMGFGPTFRKAYILPFEENLTFYLVISVRNIVATIALANYSMTTMLFPLSMALACILFMLMVLYRRRIIDKDEM